MISALYRTAAAVGPRTPAGHHCHSIIGLVQTKAVHPRHAERIRRGLIVQRDGLARLMGSIAQPASPKPSQEADRG